MTSKVDALQTQLNQAAKAFNEINDYHAVRPKYTIESADYLLKQVRVLSRDNKVIGDSATILELGSGTGLFTSSALEVLKGFSNVRYIATDPLECMEEAFAKFLPNVEFMLCKAENIRKPNI